NHLQVVFENPGALAAYVSFGHARKPCFAIECLSDAGVVVTGLEADGKVANAADGAAMPEQLGPAERKQAAIGKPVQDFVQVGQGEGKPDGLVPCFGDEAKVGIGDG